MSGRPLLALLVATAAEAARAYEPIQATDSTVAQPSLQIEINLHRGPESRINHALEVGYAGARGEASQTLDRGFVDLGTGRFDAPQSLRYDFEMNHLQVNYRWRHFPGAGGRFGYEAIIGGAVNQLRFSIHSAARSETENLAAPFLTYGVGALYRIRPGTRLHARATGHYFGLASDEVNIGRLSLFLEQAFAEHFLVRAGYAAWWIRASLYQESDLRLDFHGPALGLEVAF